VLDTGAAGDAGHVGFSPSVRLCCLLYPLFLSFFCVCSVLLLLYWKKWLCACHNKELTGHVVVALVLGFAFSTYVGMGEGEQTGGGRAGGRRASGR